MMFVCSTRIWLRSASANSTLLGHTVVWGGQCTSMHQLITLSSGAKGTFKGLLQHSLVVQGTCTNPRHKLDCILYVIVAKRETCLFSLLVRTGHCHYLDNKALQHKRTQKVFYKILKGARVNEYKIIYSILTRRKIFISFQNEKGTRNEMKLKWNQQEIEENSILLCCNQDPQCPMV